MEEKFVVMSLKEKKSKYVAKALANPTARKILDLLSSKKRNPSELAKELGVGLSTIQYNLDQLKKAGLIRAMGKKYSKKGREIRYYEPEKKMIILAPKESDKKNILAMLGDKIIASCFVISATFSGLIFQRAMSPSQIQGANTYPLVAEARALTPSMDFGVAMSSAEPMIKQAVEATPMYDTYGEAAVASHMSEPTLWPYFLIASLAIVVIYFILKWRKKK